MMKSTTSYNASFIAVNYSICCQTICCCNQGASFGNHGSDRETVICNASFFPVKNKGENLVGYVPNIEEGYSIVT